MGLVRVAVLLSVVLLLSTLPHLVAAQDPVEEERPAEGGEPADGNAVVDNSIFDESEPVDDEDLFGDDQGPMTDPDPESPRWVEATMLIDQPSVTTLSITALLTIRKFDVQGSNYSSADNISDAYHQLVRADTFARENNQSADREEEFVSDLEASATASLQEILERAFPGANVTVDPAIVDRSTFAEPDERPFEPGVGVLVTAWITRTPEDIGLGNNSAEDLYAFFDAGATVASTLTLVTEPGYEIVYALTAPPTLEFASADAGTLAADGSFLSLPVPYGSSGVPVRLTLRSVDAPTYEASNASIGITVDLKNLDISLGGAMKKDLGNILIDLAVKAELGVIDVPEDLAAGIPPNATIERLSSDAIRLLLERGTITQSEFDRLEESLLKQVSDQLGGALGGSVDVKGGFDKATLASDLIASPLSGDKPLVFEASASVRKPLAGGPVQPAAAIALYSTSFPLTLPKVEGLDTTYTVILPRGLAVTDFVVEGGTYETGTSADGRDLFVVKPSGDRADVTATMAVTPGFVMAKFWPVVLLAVILLVLVIGTPIALVLTRRRKKRT